MATAYSFDLRDRVLAAYEKKELNKGEIATFFKVGPKTIYNWVKRRKLTGEVKPKMGYQKGHSHKSVEREKFKEFRANNPNLSLQELSEKWGGVSPTTIGRMLHKIGFTFKKRIWL